MRCLLWEFGKDENNLGNYKICKKVKIVVKSWYYEWLLLDLYWD